MSTSFLYSGKRLVSPALLLLLFMFPIMSHALPVAAAEKPQTAGKINEQKLLGQWLRPDGGYILELKEIGKNGTLKALYFNPRPINIAKAALSRKGGWLMIFVELRDVNYPGSKYNLQYDHKTDRLIGTYFQAMQRSTYFVEFVRAK